MIAKQLFPKFQGKEKRIAVIILGITLTMLYLDYFGIQKAFFELNLKMRWFNQKNDVTFWANAYASLNFFIFLFLLPLSLSSLYPAKEKSITGLSLAASKSHLKSYLVIAAAMIPFLFFVTMSPSLHLFYPLYSATTWQDFLLYELIYLSQFVGTEFFFRGWPLQQLDRELGKISIVIMTLPYALIHIHKPLPEALGAVVAGMVLGHLALKTKSIWPGVFLHMSIALSSDLFCLFHHKDSWFYN